MKRSLQNTLRKNVEKKKAYLSCWAMRTPRTADTPGCTSASVAVPLLPLPVPLPPPLPWNDRRGSCRRAQRIPAKPPEGRNSPAMCRGWRNSPAKCPDWRNSPVKCLGWRNSPAKCWDWRNRSATQDCGPVWDSTADECPPQSRHLDKILSVKKMHTKTLIMSCKKYLYKRRITDFNDPPGSEIFPVFLLVKSYSPAFFKGWEMFPLFSLVEQYFRAFLLLQQCSPAFSNGWEMFSPVLIDWTIFSSIPIGSAIFSRVFYCAIYLECGGPPAWPGPPWRSEGRAAGRRAEGRTQRPAAEGRRRRPASCACAKLSYTVKKVIVRMSQTKLSLARNNLINNSRPGEFGQWHLGWGREKR